MAIPSTMKGVTLTAPYHISIQEHPTPKIEMDGDAIIRVHLAGLCGETLCGFCRLCPGSDLHWYRGHQLREFEPFIMGHEALGEIVAVGKDVKHFKPGDMAISPFSLSCGEYETGHRQILAHLREQDTASTASSITQLDASRRYQSAIPQFQALKPNTFELPWRIRLCFTCPPTSRKSSVWS